MIAALHALPNYLEHPDPDVQLQRLGIVVPFELSSARWQYWAAVFAPHR